MATQKDDNAKPAAQTRAAKTTTGGPDDALQLEAFAAETELRTNAKNAAACRRVVEKFIGHAKIRRPEEVTWEALQTYLANRRNAGNGPKSLKNMLSQISTWCDHLIRRGRIADNPCRKIKLKRPDRRAPAFLDEAQLAQALALAESNGIYPEVALAVATGMRLGELMRLRWEDIDTSPEKRTVTVRKSKSGKWRIIPLSDMALDALARQRAKNLNTHTVFPVVYLTKNGRSRIVMDQPRNNDFWSRMLYPISRAIPAFQIVSKGAVGSGWHLFRHTFATRLAQTDTNLEQIRLWLGHSDIRMTQVYVHLVQRYNKNIERASMPTTAAAPQATPTNAGKATNRTTIPNGYMVRLQKTVKHPTPKGWKATPWHEAAKAAPAAACTPDDPRAAVAPKAAKVPAPPTATPVSTPGEAAPKVPGLAVEDLVRLAVCLGGLPAPARAAALQAMPEETRRQLAPAIALALSATPAPAPAKTAGETPAPGASPAPAGPPPVPSAPTHTAHTAHTAIADANAHTANKKTARAIQAVMGDGALTRAQRAVIVAVIREADNAKGTACSSYRQLHEAHGLSFDSIRAGIRAGLAAGYLTRAPAGGRGAVTYRVTVPSTHPSPGRPATPRRGAGKATRPGKTARPGRGGRRAAAA